MRRIVISAGRNNVNLGKVMALVTDLRKELGAFSGLQWSLLWAALPSLHRAST